MIRKPKALIKQEIQAPRSVSVRYFFLTKPNVSDI